MSEIDHITNPPAKRPAFNDILPVKADDYTESNVEYTSEYWGSQDGGLQKGDRKLVYLLGIDTVEEMDEATGEYKTIKTASMMEAADKLRNIRNSSSVLVSNVSRIINSGLHLDPETGKPILFYVTYLGKAKGQKYSYDTWSIVPAKKK